MSDVLQAVAAGQAVMAFTCYSADTADVVLSAAEDRSTPVVLLVGEQSFLRPGGRRLVLALRAMADSASVAAAVQLDHTREVAVARSALDAGVHGVMADGSALGFDQNVALTAEVVALARGYDAWVEGELGQVPGDEEVAVGVEAVAAGTDPARARAFVLATGVDLLAVAIGNVHGPYVTPPVLGWDRLAALEAVAGVPLTLHGASGIAADDVRRAIRSGVRKVNVNTELRDAWYGAMASGLASTADGLRQLELLTEVSAAVRTVVDTKLDLALPRPA